MNLILTQQLIKIGTAYVDFNPESGKYEATSFLSYVAAAAPRIKGPNGEVQFRTIVINPNGAFYTGQIPTLNGGSLAASSFWGIKAADVQAFIILHELVHVTTGVTHGSNSDDFNKKLRDACFLRTSN